MNDDTAILLFLAVGAVVLIGIVVFGILSSRRKRTAQTRSFTVRQAWIGEQPFFESSDLALDDKRQEELFRQTYPLGGTLAITVAGADGEGVEREVEVARIGRSLRSGWPNAKLGLSAYFREWEHSEFPTAFAVKGSGGVVEIAMDADGVIARDASGADVWNAAWSSLLFSNGPDIVLGGGSAGTVRFEYVNGSELEELLIKYGTLKQMHF